jgi:hypothetical protein
MVTCILALVSLPILADPAPAIHDPEVLIQHMMGLYSRQKETKTMWSGTIRNQSIVVSENNRVASDWTMEHLRNRQAKAAARVLLERPGGRMDDEEGEVLAVNGRYAFKLTRQGRNRPWTLVHLDLKEDVGWRRSVSMPNHTQVPLAGLAYYIPGEELGFYQECLGKYVRSDARVQQLENGLVRLTFRLTPRDESNKDAWLRHVDLHLDPQMGYGIREYQLELQPHAKRRRSVKGTKEYRTTSEQEIIPAREESVARHSDTGSVVKNIYEYQIESRADPPESAFTLTAFGLQEPPGIDWSPPTPWWLYASSGGVALLIVAVVIYRLSRRAA